MPFRQASPRLPAERRHRNVASPISSLLDIPDKVSVGAAKSRKTTVMGLAEVAALTRHFQTQAPLDACQLQALGLKCYLQGLAMLKGCLATAQKLNLASRLNFDMCASALSGDLKPWNWGLRHELTPSWTSTTETSHGTSGWQLASDPQFKRELRLRPLKALLGSLKSL